MSYKAHNWNDVLSRFEQAPPVFKPMADLITRICSSPYRDKLFPVKSMFTLLVFQTEDWQFGIEELRINYLAKERIFHFEYSEHPNRKNKWTKECSVEEGYSAFIHFLKLKNWFPVTEVERGA
jgi:hypothetical protein